MGQVHFPVVGACTICIFDLGNQFAIRQGNVFCRNGHDYFFRALLIRFIDGGETRQNWILFRPGSRSGWAFLYLYQEDL